MDEEDRDYRRWANTLRRYYKLRKCLSAKQRDKIVRVIMKMQLDLLYNYGLIV